MKTRKYLDILTPYKLFPVSRKDKIRLDLNENTMGCSLRVIEAIRNLRSESISIYPEYSNSIEQLSPHFKIPPENILLTNGADDAIRTVMETYIEIDDTILLPVPTFSMYEIFAGTMGARIVSVLYNKDFSFPTNRLLKSLNPEIKLIVIVNPGSPTGTSIEKKDLLKILEKANNAIVLLDEAYHHFANETYVDLIKHFKNLVVIQTFSKAYGLAGLRLGILFSDIRNINELKKVSPPYSVNSIAVIAGLAALKDKNYTESIIQNIQLEKEFLQRELVQAGLKVRQTKTNFILVNVGKWADEVYQKLLELNILVKNIDDLPLMKGYLRITVGTRRENQIFLEALKEIIPPEVILFDMDGVMVDVSKSYRLVIKKTVESFSNQGITYEEIESYKSRGGYNNDWDITEAILNNLGIAVPHNKIVRIFQQYYLGNNFNGFIKNEKWLLKRSTLNKLKQNYRVGIVTGRPRIEAECALKKAGFEKDFDVLITMEETNGKGKPNPYGIELALQKLHARRAVFLGDNVDDIKAAIAAGIIPIGVLPPHTKGRKTVKLLQKFGAKRVLESVNDIVRVLE